MFSIVRYSKRRPMVILENSNKTERVYIYENQVCVKKTGIPTTVTPALGSAAARTTQDNTTNSETKQSY
jgi:hypothetical protein